MFKNDRFKKVLVISIVLVLALSTIAIAANEVYQKKLTATIGRIKFKVDGKDITKEIEEKYKAPAFTVKEFDSRSYVPVRAIAELMGMEVNWDEETHTAEIIDVKSKAYEEEIKKKDKEISELKKEIEKLKENVVEERDLKAIEKKLNDKYGTYKDVDFDITLKESTNRIDVDIVMDLRDGRQESAWNKMSYNNRKTMIEDIVDIISSEFPKVDIYGTIYDEFFKRDIVEFNKKQNGKLNINRSDRTWDAYDRYIDDIVYEEFWNYGIEDAYIRDIREDSYKVSFDIVFSDRYSTEWRDMGGKIESILDRIADDVLYYYDYYGYYDYNYNRDVSIDIYMDNKYLGRYYRYYNERYGKFYW